MRQSAGVMEWWSNAKHQTSMTEVSVLSVQVAASMFLFLTPETLKFHH
jgi:hypothetical protein